MTMLVSQRALSCVKESDLPQNARAPRRERRAFSNSHFDALREYHAARLGALSLSLIRVGRVFLLARAQAGVAGAYFGAVYALTDNLFVAALATRRRWISLEEKRENAGLKEKATREAPSRLILKRANLWSPRIRGGRAALGAFTDRDRSRAGSKRPQAHALVDIIAFGISYRKLAHSTPRIGP